MSYTTQTLSCAEQETDFTVYLSPFAKERLAAWRRGELKGEKPQRHVQKPHKHVQRESEIRNQAAVPHMIEAYNRLGNIRWVAKELALPYSAVYDALIREGVITPKPYKRQR